MTPKELITMLVSQEGPCGKLCSYCTSDINLSEVKECVEELIRKVYVTEQCNDDLIKELIKIRGAYLKATGKEYKE